MPPLAPGAHYTYLWWFGDNGYSFEETPRRSFLRSNETLEVFAGPTENYGTGGPPPAYTTSNIHPTVHLTINEEIMDDGEYVHIQHYRNAVPEDTMYLIITYAGIQNQTLYNARLKLLADPDVIILSDMIQGFPSFTPNNEFYNGYDTWHLRNLTGEQERSILVPVKVNSTERSDVSFSAELFTSEPEEKHSETLFYEAACNVPVAESHDPNMMVERSNAKNDCHYGGKTIEYTVHFENIGEGATHYVSVVAHLDEDLNMSTIRSILAPKEYGNTSVVESTLNHGYKRSQGPIYKIDTAAHKIYFEFNDLQLKSPHETNNLRETRSSVTFTIDVNEGYVFGPPITSYSTIVFDTNDPMDTDTAYTSCRNPDFTTSIVMSSCENSQSNGYWGLSLCCWLAILLAVLLLITILTYLKRRRSTN